MYSHLKQIVTAGTPFSEAERVLIMIHGRGATAAGITSLERELGLSATSIIAPQATNHSWYPYSFLAPAEDNQPSLDSALSLIGELVEDILSQGMPLEKIYFLGFSQGACLALEYVARNARKYGGIIALTGGLIGEKLNIENYRGNFHQTPILITTGDPDPHVPLQRVEESVIVLTELGADVSLKVYPERPHTITAEELELAKEVLSSQLQ